MGGLSVGVFWGLVISVVVLAAVSLSSPLPMRKAEEGVVDLAVEPEAIEETATQTPLAPEEPAAEEPAPEEPGAEAPAAEAPVAEGPISVEPASVPETAPAAEPADDPEAGDAATPEEEASLATEIPLPAGTEFNRAPPEPEATLPAPESAPTVVAPQAPALASDVTAPSFDTAPAAQPEVGTQAPAPITAVASGADSPASPANAPAPTIATLPTALSQPETSETPRVRTALLPQVAVPQDTPPTAAAADPQPMPLQTPTFPSIGAAASPESTTPELPADIATGTALETGTPEAAVLATPGFTQASSLPQVTIQTPEIMVEEAAMEEVTPESLPDATPDAMVPAIEAYAAPFDATETRPLMAIVLIDDAESQIELSTLIQFSFPVAFAVDPLHPDAAERAAAFRAAGFEVVILGTMIPEGATATDVEVAVSSALITLPEAVAMIDTPEGRIQGDRPVLDAAIDALSASGHGLLAFPRGMNAAEQSAARAGVPGATLFRLLDGEGERATIITRILGRAAFSATQEGTVIVAGHSRPDTVTALFSWALGSRSEGVALAPLSATLQRASDR